MPANTVSVARPGMWGNPHAVVLDQMRWDGETLDEHDEPVEQGPWLCKMQPDRDAGWWFPTKEAAIAKSLALYRWRLTDSPASIAAVQKDHLGSLRGKNLACWCALDQPCHADVLLELANAEVSP
jgi:hypothetical protein